MSTFEPDPFITKSFPKIGWKGSENVADFKTVFMVKKSPVFDTATGYEVCDVIN